MGRDLNKAIPEMKEFATFLIERAKSELNLNVIVTSVERLYEEQVALYAQGRSTCAEVNRLRKFVNLGDITEEQNKKKVTWTMKSKHIIRLNDNDPGNDLSRAVDFGILDNNGKYVGDIKADINKDNKQDYLQLVSLAKIIIKEKNYFILPGADFKKSKDYPHYEWNG